MIISLLRPGSLLLFPQTQHSWNQPVSKCSSRAAVTVKSGEKIRYEKEEVGELWLILPRIYGNTSQSSALHWWHNTQVTLTGHSVQRQQLWDVQTFRDILGHFPSDFWKFGSFHFKQKHASPRFHCHFLFLFKENRTATLHTPLRKLSLQNSCCDVKDKTKLHLYKYI